MTPVTAQDLTQAHVGRVDQGGYEILWLHDLPLHWRGASLTVRHTETAAQQVWDLRENETLWLRDPAPLSHVPRWAQIAETTAEDALEADRRKADRREAAYRDRYEHALTQDEVPESWTDGYITVGAGDTVLLTDQSRVRVVELNGDGTFIGLDAWHDCSTFSGITTGRYALYRLDHVQRILFDASTGRTYGDTS